MANSLNADEGQLRSAARHCHETSDDLRAGLGRLGSQMNELMAGNLTGLTGTALQTVFADLSANLAALTTSIDETARLLEQSSETFQLMDDEAARDIAGLAPDSSPISRALRPGEPK